VSERLTGWRAGRRAVAAPAWRRHTHGEQRWPSALAIVVMIGLQLLPARAVLRGPRWLLPASRCDHRDPGCANPGRMERSRSRCAGSARLIIIASHRERVVGRCARRRHHDRVETG
jgi:hypothetical protein